MMRLLSSTFTCAAIAIALVANFAPLVSSSLPKSELVGGSLNASMTCKTLRVGLHGNDAPTVECVQLGTSMGQSPSPNTNQRSCLGSDLHIYEDVDQQPWHRTSGQEICFYGTGFVNLTDFYIAFPFIQWNDHASSYYTGVWRGVFFRDSNGNGPSMPFSANSWANFGGSLPIKNDQLTSIRVDGQG